MGHASSILCLDLVRKERTPTHLVSGDKGGSLVVWNLKTLEITHSLKLGELSVLEGIAIH